jgi:hypothetical protein
MAEPTLQQVFGANAAQTETTLTISKADLATVGLTPSATNTAESQFVAMLLLAKSYLTDANLTANADQSISIVDSFDSLVARNNATYRQKVYSVNLQKLDTGAVIDPDDY